jgi:hypothetical protein
MTSSTHSNEIAKVVCPTCCSVMRFPIGTKIAVTSTSMMGADFHCTFTFSTSSSVELIPGLLRNCHIFFTSFLLLNIERNDQIHSLVRCRTSVTFHLDFFTIRLTPMWFDGYNLFTLLSLGHDYHSFPGVGTAKLSNGMRPKEINPAKHRGSLRPTFQENLVAYKLIAWVRDEVRYLPQRGFTGLDLLWDFTPTGLGPGLLVFRTRRGLHFAIAIPPFHATNIGQPRALKRDADSA